MLIGTAVLGAVVVLVWYVTVMPGTSFAGELPPISAAERQLEIRLRNHVEALASNIGERNVWHRKELDRAARYITDALTACGLTVASQEYETHGTTVRNVAAELPGVTRPDEIVVVGGHYDSVLGCPGANDNGTGVAAVLELAARFAGRPVDRTIRFVAFVNEEPPFCFTRDMGSRVYAKRSRRHREQIVAMLSLETIGFYSSHPRSQQYPFPFGLRYPRTGNFIAFVGNLSSRSLVRRCVRAFRSCVQFPSEGAAAPGYLPGIFWSDHWSFWQEGYKALMVTDTAPFRYPHYHTVDDTPDKVDFVQTARVVVGLDGVIRELASESPGRSAAAR